MAFRTSRSFQPSKLSSTRQLQHFRFSCRCRWRCTCRDADLCSGPVNWHLMSCACCACCAFISSIHYLFHVSSYKLPSTSTSFPNRVVSMPTVLFYSAEPSLSSTMPKLLLSPICYRYAHPVEDLLSTGFLKVYIGSNSHQVKPD